MGYIYIFYTLLKIEFLLIIKCKWNYTHMTGGGVKKKFSGAKLCQFDMP